MDTKPAERRAFVLGLDGVPWSLIERWTDEGKLPSFRRLIDEGAAGGLESTTPPTTPVAWPAITSGNWQGHHGLYGFTKLSSSYTHRPYTAGDVRRPLLWDMVEPAVVGNVPMTYPARPIDGRMVTGMMSPGLNEQAAHPTDLREEIRERIPAYTIGLDWSTYADRIEEFLEDHDALARRRRELMRLLMETEDWRLFFFVYTAPDRLQHLVWDEEVLLEHYRWLDDTLGEVMDYCEHRESDLFVVSDHGFGPVSRTVHPNALLEREGYLTRKEKTVPRRLLDGVGLTQQRVKELVKAAGIERALAHALPEALVKSVAGQLPGEHSLYAIDFPETRAFLHAPGNVYINDVDRFEAGTVPASERGDLKRELASWLSSVTDPRTGDRVLDVHDGDELFPAEGLVPDLVVEAREGYGLSASLSDRPFSDAEDKAAMHEPTGIYLAWGPNIEPGTSVTGATVVDVAPTLLHAVGEPVPEGADGRVLGEVFRSGSEAADRPVEYAAYGTNAPGDGEHEDFDEVESRLQGLGYLE